LGKAAQLRNHTDSYSSSQFFSANCAVLYDGSQRFKLTLRQDMNSIRLDIEGLHPRGVFNRIMNLIQSIVSECFHSLSFFVVVEHAESGHYINLESVRHACGDVTLKNEYRGSASVAVGDMVVDRRRLVELYGPWVRKRELLDWYDAFLSYRWKVDDSFVTGLNDALLDVAIGEHHRAIEIFQDKKRLPIGSNFLDGFKDALISSLVVVPIMSIFALDRMVKHNPEEVDYTLLEWILACQYYEINRSVAFNHPKVRVKAVLPIQFEDIGPILDKMSNVEPIKTWHMAEEALLNQGLTAAFPCCTVKALMKEHLLLFLSGRSFGIVNERLRLGSYLKEVPEDLEHFKKCDNLVHLMPDTQVDADESIDLNPAIKSRVNEIVELLSDLLATPTAQLLVQSRANIEAPDKV
jgi:hypothetical protein